MTNFPNDKQHQETPDMQQDVEMAPLDESSSNDEEVSVILANQLDFPGISAQHHLVSKHIDRMDEPRRLTPDDLDERRIIYPESRNRRLVNRFRELRTRLLEASGGNNFTLVVTGATASSGSSFIALNLAAAFAFDQAKTSLLIDCNLREPSLHNMLDMIPETGLTDFLDEPDFDIASIIYPTGIPRMRLIPAGSRREMPAEFFTSFRMRKFLLAVRKRYPDRFIILDTASIADTPDARILGEFCDMTLLVAPHAMVTAQQVEKAANSLYREKLAGVVING